MMNTNPLLNASGLPYGAPNFDDIRTEHYLPAFTERIAQARAEIDRIASCPDMPTFENTIEALEYAEDGLNEVADIFYNLLEADSDDSMQEVAETLSPMMTELSSYISLNEALFARVKSVYERRGTLGLPRDGERLLEDTYKSFVRSGANLPPEDRQTYRQISEELSLATLQFGKNVLDATNAYTLHITDPAQLAGLPDFVREAAAEAARGRNLEGWIFDLTAPSFRSFMKYSESRELRREIYLAYNTRAVGGPHDNLPTVSRIVSLRTRMARLLGYASYAEYALEERMARSPQAVDSFLSGLLEPSLPAATRELEEVTSYAAAHGFTGDRLEPWDFSYWSEKYREAAYDVNDGQLKPYFRLDNCVEAVFDLARRLYGLHFEERSDIPVYHPDVKVYDVTDETGAHKALFYADFFPRPSKRGGAWMTEFRGQSIRDGVERRPFVSIVTNFTKPTPDTPSLITHDELTTLLHEFGHSLHGILAQGRYGSQTGTNVARDFVELPSQIMENWAFEPEYLDTFARHYRTGETMPHELVDRLVKARNFLAGYYQVRQLQFGILDMAWHSTQSETGDDVIAFEKAALAPSNVLPSVPECCISTSFGHIFSGGYAAGYYSYKWAEVLEADAFSFFKEKGIFSREAADAFRDQILTRGSTEDEAVLYRNFRGHDPKPEALLEKLGILKTKG